MADFSLEAGASLRITSTTNAAWKQTFTVAIMPGNVLRINSLRMYGGSGCTIGPWPVPTKVAVAGQNYRKGENGHDERTSKQRTRFNGNEFVFEHDDGAGNSADYDDLIVTIVKLPG